MICHNENCNNLVPELDDGRRRKYCCVPCRENQKVLNAERRRKSEGSKASENRKYIQQMRAYNACREFYRYWATRAIV